mgnify:CR=1 FL=1
MHRIDGDNVAVSLPTPQSVGGTVGYFAAEDVIPATQVTGDWLNAVQEEILGPIVAASITPSKTSRDQLLKAIRLLAEKERTIPLGSGAAVQYTAGSASDITITQAGNQTVVARASSSAYGVQVAWPLPLNIRSGIKLSDVRLVMRQEADFSGTVTLLAAYLTRVNADATTTILGTVDIVALNPTLGSWVVVDFGDFGTSATEFTTGQGLYLSVIASGTGGGVGELRFSLIGLSYGF